MESIVRLRDVRESDLPTFFQQQNDRIANELAGFPPRDWEAFMDHWHAIMRDPQNALKTIVVNSRVAGNIVSFVRFGEREVGYWVGREYWSQGIATAALARFVRLVSARPLLARVAAHNRASIRVLEKCGFALQGDDGEGGVLLRLDD